MHLSQRFEYQVWLNFAHKFVCLLFVSSVCSSVSVNDKAATKKVIPNTFRKILISSVVKVLFGLLLVCLFFSSVSANNKAASKRLSITF